MFIGHFAVGFGAKRYAPRVSLGTLFMASLFLDLLWPALLLVGIERVRIAPGATQVAPLIFEHYQYSHSLLAVAGWAALIGGLYRYLRRDGRGAAIVAALVVSHWLLDAVVHQPDLPIFPSGGPLVGSGVWSSLPLTLAVEVALLFLGVWLYVRSTVAADAIGKSGFLGLVVFLLAIYGGNLFGAPPPSTEAIAWAGHMQWILVLWGYWIDKHRRLTIEA